MNKQGLSVILGGLLGLVVGIIGGGFIGLMIGGTFLGGFDIYERIGFEGYELAAYVGASIGAGVMVIVGIKVALSSFK